jgi:hypothetical protein
MSDLIVPFLLGFTILVFFYAFWYGMKPLQPTKIEINEKKLQPTKLALKQTRSSHVKA